MALSFHEVKELSESAALQVSSSKEEWKKFLAAAGYLTKYPFEHQLQIFAQKPEATACASINVWNSDKFHCWVNRGAKGIALVNSDSEDEKVRYVFDISDVHKSKAIGKYPVLFRMDPEHEESVLKRLDKTYGSTNAEASFADRIIELSRRLAEDLDYDDLLTDILERKAGSNLERMDDGMILDRMKKCVSDSIAYTVLKRLQIPEEQYEAKLDSLKYIKGFNTVDTITFLGSVVQEQTMPVFRQISSAITLYNREHAQENLEKGSEARYNDLKRESVEQDDTISEGGYRDEIRIYAGGGLSDPEHRAEYGTGTETGQIRTDETEISGRTPTQSIRGDASQGRAESALPGGRETGERYAGYSDRTEEESRGSDGGTQGIGSDGMGSQDGNDNSRGGGSGFERSNLRIEDALQEASEEVKVKFEQLNLFDMLSPVSLQRGTIAIAETEKISDSAILLSENERKAYREEDIDAILRTLNKRSNERLYVKLAGNLSREDLGKEIKKEYLYKGFGYSFDNAGREENVSVWFDESGVSFSHDSDALNHSFLHLSYEEVADRFLNMATERGDFLSMSEALRVPEIERKDLSEDIFFYFRDGFDENVSDVLGLKATGFTFPDATQEIANALSDDAFFDKAVSTIQSFDKDLKAGKREARFMRIASGGADLLKRLNDLHDFTSKFFQNMPLKEEAARRLRESFLTLNEIDYSISRGGNISGGKERIGWFFSESHSQKEQIEFLKNEYGTGGRNRTESGGERKSESWDAKGYLFERISSYERGDGREIRLLLPWNKVAERVEVLSQNGLFKTDKERVASPALDAVPLDKQAEERPLEQEDKLLLEAKELINQYCNAEFDSNADISDLSNIGLAYTEYGNHDEIPVQVSVDLQKYALNTYVGDALFASEQYDSLEDIKSQLLEHLQFDDLIPYQDDVIEFYEKNNQPYFEIYQLDEQNEKAREYLFEGFEAWKEGGLPVSADLYKHIYKGSFEPGLSSLDDIYEKFNIAHPEDYKGHSLSVSDIIVVHKNGKDDAFFVDSFGFKEIDDFFRKPERAVSFTVAEVSEYHDLGNFHDNIESAEEAVKLFEQMLSDSSLSGVPAIGINLHVPGTASEKDIQCDFLTKNRLDLEPLMYLPEMRENQEVVEALHALQKAYPNVEIRGRFPDEILKTQLASENEAEEVLPETAREQSVESPAPVSDFHISDEHLGEGTPSEKIQRNIDAIRLLKQIEDEGRTATGEEQEVLSKYVGWGGLPDVFDESKGNAFYKEVKDLLTEDEYRMARESTLNAHYTSPAVISHMYKALERMGFRTGNVLEPSMGVGNFFGMRPESMENSRFYGVELDSISGRIAKQLYPKSSVQVCGFEETSFENDFFDVAVGNVPFGDYKVNDKDYNKENFMIHDYFFAKALDKVRSGGIVAFITSKGTLDKQNSAVRRYLAQRAELLGAVRLPNTAFKANAGTEVTSDIIFLKKRDRAIDIEPDWLFLDKDENGITMNRYFVDHPEMIAGHMEMISGPFGQVSACLPNEGVSLDNELNRIVPLIGGEIEEAEISVDDVWEEVEDVIPASPDVKNFSYAIVDDKLYYRENSVMRLATISEDLIPRGKALVELRDCTKKLIDMQLEDYPDEEIVKERERLNTLYDSFVKEYGTINSRTNKRAFDQDSGYCLLCSLEKVDEKGNLKGKADMFTKRTIKKTEAITSVDTASEALAISLSEKASVDIAYMSELCSKSEEEIISDLSGVIFKDPVSEKWLTADEYLSGDVRSKLQLAHTFAEGDPSYAINEESLKKVMPKELEAGDIDVRLGAAWIDPEYIDDFMEEVFKTPHWSISRGSIKTQFSPVTGEWNISGKKNDYNNAVTNSTYGTSRINAYQILEKSLNLKDVRIYDMVIEDGKEKRVLNKKETAIADSKQESIRLAFKDWIFKDQERRSRLVKKYNVLFNSIRPREFDGSHLRFPGMSSYIGLKPYQKNAVARILYGDNTLLAHCVSAGKTYEMVAAAMESKRLGLCQKSMFVVPNYLTVQWASSFLRLYPGANILAATMEDFEPANRKKFCSRIATGDYDAVIIGHSQFEKIPLSKDCQIRMIEEQVEAIEDAIRELKMSRGDSFSIKQMEKTKKGLRVRLDKLNDQSDKDDVVTFEQLGVDRLFVDESHSFKNLFLYTKMRNVAGIAQTEAKKSSDMYAKCMYMDEITGGKGITFATGTPISNSMTELYTNMRYLQSSLLKRLNLNHFDSWASTFGETTTAIELSPEGTGYRAKTRFSKFYNLPELISLFKESADIQTPDMLNLPVPKAEFIDVVCPPSEYQLEMVKKLGERADAVRSGSLDPKIDNMLKITNDGRKLALDQRLINPLLPDDENSKASKCVENAFSVWEETKEQSSAQLIFCDLSTPKGDGTFNVYDDIKKKLIEKGVPEKEIAFVHDANTELQKADLFAKVKRGQVRFLLGSTAKMGAGTNVQDHLVALHHLDVPWRPSDIEQQEGRIIRQGNQNEHVKIFRYITEKTFDAYSWQVIENKQKFIGQIMTSKSPMRSCEDVDEVALSYAEVKALATGNPYIKEKMELDIDVARLKLAKSNHVSAKYRLEDDITRRYPRIIASKKEAIAGYDKDIAQYEQNKPADKDAFSLKIGDKTYTDKAEAGEALIAACRGLNASSCINHDAPIGEFLGFKLAARFDPFLVDDKRGFSIIVKGAMSYSFELSDSGIGNVTKLLNRLEGIAEQKKLAAEALDTAEKQLADARIEVERPFEKEDELKGKLTRLAELNSLLDMDEKGDEAQMLGDSEDEPAQKEKRRDYDVR